MHDKATKINILKLEGLLNKCLNLCFDDWWLILNWNWPIKYVSQVKFHQGLAHQHYINNVPKTITRKIIHLFPSCWCRGLLYCSYTNLQRQAVNAWPLKYDRYATSAADQISLSICRSTLIEALQCGNIRANLMLYSGSVN